MTGTIGKRDAKQEYYQVKKARRKHGVNYAMRSEARDVTRGVRIAG